MAVSCPWRASRNTTVGHGEGASRSPFDRLATRRRVGDSLLSRDGRTSSRRFERATKRTPPGHRAEQRRPPQAPHRYARRKPEIADRLDCALMGTGQLTSPDIQAREGRAQGWPVPHREIWDPCLDVSISLRRVTMPDRPLRPRAAFGVCIAAHSTSCSEPGQTSIGCAARLCKRQRRIGLETTGARRRRARRSCSGQASPTGCRPCASRSATTQSATGWRRPAWPVSAGPRLSGYRHPRWNTQVSRISAYSTSSTLPFSRSKLPGRDATRPAEAFRAGLACSPGR